jgi:dihydroorotate dehydrogenase
MERGRGWYDAVGRRAFFALDPERAHGLAYRLLGLPLPWSRIGGVPPGVERPTTLAGIPMRLPIGLAAGFDKTCAHLDALGSLGFGYVVGGTITRAPRTGNPRPRIVRDVARGALVNAMGLPNPGAAAVARTLERTRRTCPRFVSLADEALEDVLASLSAVEPHVDGLELNASCPNVSWGRDTDTETHLRALVGAIRERTSKPLFVKLPPFEEDPEREAVLALAGVAAEAGADGFTCGNTRPVDEPRLSVGRGGLSGDPLAATTPGCVAAVRAATGLPVNACGGVSTVEHATDCLDAGASTVQVYTGLIYRGPALVGELARGIGTRASARR